MTNQWAKLDEIMTWIKKLSKDELDYFIKEIFGEDNSEEKTRFLRSIDYLKNQSDKS